MVKIDRVSYYIDIDIEQLHTAHYSTKLTTGRLFADSIDSDRTGHFAGQKAKLVCFVTQ